MAIHVMDEANRCLGCKVPQCQKGCPISTPIPEVIRLLKENKLDEAGWMLFENNPLTTVCSLICNHENQCEGHCVLGRKGSPVRFSVIEQYISSTYATKMTRGPSPSNGMKVAVVGSGPAGLTIAILMARKGYQVTIFDRNEQIGGVLRYGIPEFRLPKSVLDDIQYRHLEMKGIKIRPNTNIGSTIDMENLFRDGYKAVFVGTGVWKPNTLGIKGETFGHVHYGINYLRNPDVFRLGKTVIVIGSGNAAMDVCRTALRKGTEKVICVSRRKKIAASHHEFSYAQLEGVDFVFNKMPVEIVDEGVILRDLIENEDGSLTEVEGSDTLWTADSIMISVSQGPLNLIVSNTSGLDTTPRGLLAVDEQGRTSRPGIFASGDVVKGARTVVEAVAFSKRVAEAMDEYIQALPKE